VGAGGGTCTASGSGNINNTVNLPAGGSVTYTASCTISASATGTLSNTATVAAPGGVTDPTPGNNSATDTDALGTAADLAITKVDTPDPVPAGGSLTYDITVTNNGPNDAEFVNLDDTLPAGTTFVSLTAEPGWSCTMPAVGAGGMVSCSISLLGASSAAGFSLVVAVDSGVSIGTVITNTATVSSETFDPNQGNNSGSTDTTVANPPPFGDLSVTKADSPDPVTPGSNLVYTITVTNAGPSAATNVNLVDPLPVETTFVSLSAPGGWSCTTPAVGTNDAVLCSISSLGVGSAVFTLTVAVGAGTPPGTQIFNTATVSSDNDPDESNDNGSATTTVVSPVMISGTKTVSGTFVPGGTVTYTVVLTNSGPSAQMDNSGNEFTDVLPSSLALVSAMATSGTAVANTGTNTVTWNGSLASGGSVTITITALINGNVAPGTTISNQGNIAFDADANGTNESSAVTDNPATGAPNDPTTFQVQAAPQIPTLDGLGLAILAALLALGGAWVLRRRRSA